MKPYYVRLLGEYGVAVVAECSKDAKKLGYDYLLSEYSLTREEASWMECSCKLNRNQNIDLAGLEAGPYADIEGGIRRGLYTYTDDGICDDCKAEGVGISRYTDKDKRGHALCEACAEKRKFDGGS